MYIAKKTKFALLFMQMTYKKQRQNNKNIIFKLQACVSKTYAECDGCDYNQISKQ